MHTGPARKIACEGNTVGQQLRYGASVARGRAMIACDLREGLIATYQKLPCQKNAGRNKERWRNSKCINLPVSITTGGGAGFAQTRSAANAVSVLWRLLFAA